MSAPSPHDLLKTLYTMAMMVEARDAYTGGHLWRVAQFSRLLAGHPLTELAMDAVLLHHETPDGRGYPQGRKADDIPLVARIVGIADAFDPVRGKPRRSGRGRIARTA